MSILHDSKTQRHDLCLHQEGDGIGVALLDKGSDDSEGSDSQILKYFAFSGGIEKGV